MNEELIKAVANLLLQIDGAWIITDDDDAFEKAFQRCLEEMRKINEQST